MNIQLFKQLRVLIIISLITTTAVGQELQVGDYNKFKEKSYSPYIIGEDDDNIYTYARVKDYSYHYYFRVEAYNKETMIKLYDIKINQPKVDGNVVTLKTLNLVDGKFIVLANYFDRKTDEDVLYAFTIKTTDGSTTGDRQELFRIGVEHRKRKGGFYTFVSKDDSKILVNHTAYYHEYRHVKDRFKLIDANLDVLLEREDVFKASRVDETSLGNYIVDNDGSVYFTRYYKETGAVYLVSYNANKEYEKWEEYVDYNDMGLPRNAKLRDYGFTINSNNELLVTGFYSSEFTKNSFVKKENGAFFFRIGHHSKEIEAIVANEFEGKVLNYFAKHKSWGSHNRIRTLNKDDGGVIQIVEEARDGRNTRQLLVERGDLVILNISPDGDLLWSRKISKKQKLYSKRRLFIFFTGSRGLRLFSYPKTYNHYSYTAGITDDNVYILFNDNKRNAEKKINSSPYEMGSVRQSVVMLYSIDIKSGDEDKEVLGLTKDMDVKLAPYVHYQGAQNGNIYIFGRKGKQYKYGSLAYDE